MIAKCPSCGAPVAPDATTCRYCNSALTAPPRGQAPHAASASTRSVLPLAIAGIVIAGGVTASTWFAARSQTVAGGPSGGGGGLFAAARERPAGLLAAITDAEGKDDLLVHFYRDDKHHLARVDGRTLTPTWQDDRGTKSSLASIAATDRVAFVATEERLVAHDLADGRRLWEVGLVAEIQHADQLRVAGDSVVAWQKDNSVQAFDQKTGATRWTRKQKDSFFQLPIVAGKVVAEADGDPSSFVLVDPATGVAGPPAKAGCDRAGASFASGYDNKQQILATPDGQSLVLVVGVHQPCVVRWDAATGKPRWATKSADSIRLGWHTRDALLVDAAGVYLAGDEVLLALDAETGKLRDLVRDKESEFRLRFVHDGAVIALRWPDYDSNKLTLVAYDPTGAPRWQHRLTATDRDGREWGVAPGPGAVYLWQSSEDDKAVILERIDIKTGQVLARTPMSRPDDDAPRIFDQIVAPRRAWIAAIFDFATVDLTTGAVEHI